MNLYYARLSKFIKHVLYERLSKLRCKNIVIYKKMNFVSLWLHTKFAHRSISSIIHIESRIHKSFDRIPFVRSEIRMKIKKELTGRIRRGQTRGVTEREKKTGEIWPTGSKAKSNLIHTISSRRIGGPCNRVRIVGTSFWRVGRTWQNILHFRDEVSCDCNFGTTFISR